MSARIEMGPVVGRIAGDDAIIIARVALRLREGLQAPLRASAEIGMLRRSAVESPDDGLVRLRGYMHGSMREVDYTLHVPLRPMRIVIRNVAGVGAAGSVTPSQWIEHRSVVDGPRQTAVACGQQFFIPC